MFPLSSGLAGQMAEAPISSLMGRGSAVYLSLDGGNVGQMTCGTVSSSNVMTALPKLLWSWEGIIVGYMLHQTFVRAEDEAWL